MAQVFVASKLGQEVNARNLGTTKMGTLKIPNRARFNVMRKKDNMIYEADMLLENDKTIIAEITTSRIDVKYIKETMGVWKADIYWFISYKGFTKSAIKFADECSNIILTTIDHLEHELRKTF